MKCVSIVFLLFALFVAISARGNGNGALKPVEFTDDIHKGEMLQLTTDTFGKTVTGGKPAAILFYSPYVFDFKGGSVFCVEVGYIGWEGR